MALIEPMCLSPLPTSRSSDNNNNYNNNNINNNKNNSPPVNFMVVDTTSLEKGLGNICCDTFMSTE